ncbi:hypothetical protein GJ744_004176 [Endocarpon pusillum]|uniref:Cytochrome P450 n=1 Tax=Endocarpon pusillum TaxID=364733 RepID=A0A8H7E7Z5_9EURO|nr:hypothetical protein GJ744_004176 [Endocarpon pusillum]
MWAAPSAEKKSISAKNRPAHEMIEEYHRQQLHPGDRSNSLLADRLVPNLINKIQGESLKVHSACLHSSADSLIISFWDWCTDIFIHGITNAYYGKTLSKVNPDILSPYMVWEATNWKYMYRFPRVLSGDMIAAKDEIIDTFRDYFDTSNSQRMDRTYFVGAVEDELRECGLTSDEIARINMLHHWAITGNIYKISFWTIAYLAHNPSLREAIRAEVFPRSGQRRSRYGVLDRTVPQDQGSLQ